MQAREAPLTRSRPLSLFTCLFTRPSRRSTSFLLPYSTPCASQVGLVRLRRRRSPHSPPPPPSAEPAGAGAGARALWKAAAHGVFEQSVGPPESTPTINNHQRLRRDFQWHGAYCLKIQPASLNWCEFDLFKFSTKTLHCASKSTAKLVIDIGVFEMHF